MVRQNGVILASAAVTESAGKGRKRVLAESESEETIDMTGTGEKKASVSTGYGVTINLGNFRSARVDVHVTLPSGESVEEIEATYKRCQEFAKGKVKTEANAIKEKAGIKD